MPELKHPELAPYVAHLNWWLRLQRDVVRHTAGAVLLRVAQSPLATDHPSDLLPGNLSYLITLGVVEWKQVDRDQRVRLCHAGYRDALARCRRNGDGLLVLRKERPQPRSLWEL